MKSEFLFGYAGIRSFIEDERNTYIFEVDFAYEPTKENRLPDYLELSYLIKVDRDTLKIKDYLPQQVIETKEDRKNIYEFVEEMQKQPLDLSEFERDENLKTYWDISYKERNSNIDDFMSSLRQGEN